MNEQQKTKKRCSWNPPMLRIALTKLGSHVYYTVCRREAYIAEKTCRHPVNPRKHLQCMNEQQKTKKRCSWNSPMLRIALTKLGSHVYYTVCRREAYIQCSYYSWAIQQCHCFIVISDCKFVMIWIGWFYRKSIEGTCLIIRLPILIHTLYLLTKPLFSSEWLIIQQFSDLRKS